MTFKEWIDRHYPENGALAWLAFALELVAVVTLFALMILTCLDVTGRYVFNDAIDGSVELTQIGLAILVFAEMPVITWRGGHVVVDLLDGILSKAIIKTFALISAFLISSSLYFVAVRIFELAERSMRRGVVTELLEWPEAYIMYYIAIMSWVTAAMMISYGIYRIWFDKR